MIKNLNKNKFIRCFIQFCRVLNSDLVIERHANRLTRQFLIYNFKSVKSVLNLTFVNMCLKRHGSGQMCVYVWDSKRFVFFADCQMCEKQIKVPKIDYINEKLFFRRIFG